MNENKTTKTGDHNISSSDLNHASHHLSDHLIVNLNIYKELDENPNQNLDLVVHIKNQLKQLELIHKRKMFMIKEISSLRR